MRCGEGGELVADGKLEQFLLVDLMVKTNQEIAQNLFWWTKQTIKEEKKFSESQTGQRKK